MWALLGAAFSCVMSAEDVSVVYKGAGWLQFGRVEHSSDTISNTEANNFNNNWIQNTGGQITAVAKISENWEGGLGLGAIQVSNSRGSLFGAHTWSNQWNPFVTEARATYSLPLGDKRKLQLTLGSFPYDYNPDIRNFGLYLTRGHVYPGTLFSGFETKHILPIATQVGGLARIQWGGFQNDLLLNSETETKPYFDFSLLDIANYQVTSWLQVGAGVNFYRLVEQNSKVTSPGTECITQLSTYQDGQTGNNDEKCYVLDTVYARVARVDTSVAYKYDAAGAVALDSALRFTPIVDSTVVDTVTGSMSGIKLMASFHLDPKGFFGSNGPFGKEDWILYGEAAILGLKNYPKYYEDIWQRMPVMVGLNLPAFGLLTKFTFEIEYFGSRNYADYGNTETNGSWVPRRIPGSTVFETTQPTSFNGNSYNKVSTWRDADNVRNDWKWSLYASRVLMGHLKIAIQAASDHLVLPSPPAAQDPSWAEVLTTPKDWYWMCKLAYFF